ncbi:MAG: TonB-dependent receptor, partial [Leptospiraceae bacterium]|nr:TonB-dependent receptor [Leptospiraceae bacterium]
TLTPFREIIFGGETIFGQKKETPEVQKEEESFVVEIEKEFQEDKDGITAGKKKKEKQKEVKEANRGNEGNKEKTPEKTGPVTKIPTNYRFKQDFRFRWNGARITRIPTKKLNSYKYFKNMLRKIEDKFAPPGGGNFAYRDMAGIVAGQGIIPGEVGVVFLLDENGKVIDVKKTGSHSQSIVENACIDAIQGQDFGPVPDDIKEQGLIFGINFIFPGVMRY